MLDVSLSRILVSLCWTSGWLTTWIECGKDMRSFPLLLPTLRDAVLRTAPQGEALLTPQPHPEEARRAVSKDGQQQSHSKHRPIAGNCDRRTAPQAAFRGNRATGQPGAG